MNEDTVDVVADISDQLEFIGEAPNEGPKSDALYKPADAHFDRANCVGTTVRGLGASHGAVSIGLIQRLGHAVTSRRGAARGRVQHKCGSLLSRGKADAQRRSRYAGFLADSVEE